MTNVWQQIDNEAPNLAKKLSENTDLANFVMGLLGRLIIMCQERGAPYEGIMFSDLSSANGEFKSRVTFNHINVGTIGQMPERSDFFQYTQSRSNAMALVLARNNRLNEFFQTLIEQADRYALDSNIPFPALKVHSAFISPDNVLVLKVGRAVLNA